MFVFGPLWFVLLMLVIYYFVKRNSKANIPHMRQCPDCAELIKGEARVCRFCGRRLEITEAAMGSSRSDGNANKSCVNCGHLYNWHVGPDGSTVLCEKWSCGCSQFRPS
jgi:hypothetical protein